MGEPHKTEQRKVRISAWYFLAILTGSFGIGELCHFLIGVTNIYISQDLQYGDQSCLSKTNVPVPENGIACADLPDENQCTNATYEDQVYCQWNYNGLGIQYQILAGPSFVAAYTIGAIVMGVQADTFNRKNVLTACTLLFSVCTIITGFAQAFWQLVLLRIGLAIGESACQPLSAAMISDLFPQTTRGVAMGIVNLGIHIGSALSFAIGNYVTAANILGEGWRWSFFISGVPGLLVAALLLFTTKEPERVKSTELDETEPDMEKDATNEKIEISEIFAFFCKPTSIFLCSYAWGYNSALYFQNYYPTAEIGTWLTVIPLIGGTSLIYGGMLSDKFVSKLGLQARAWVLAGNQLLGAPFAFGVLYLRPPYSFISLLVYYLVSESWIGILFAIIVELSPAKGMTTILAIFLFLMNNIGGNVPLVVDPLTKAIGYRGALVIMYPGLTVLSGVVFGICGLLVRNRGKTDEAKTNCEQS